LKDILCRLSVCDEIIKLRNERQLENRSISVRLNSWDSLHRMIKRLSGAGALLIELSRRSFCAAAFLVFAAGEYVT